MNNSHARLLMERLEAADKQLKELAFLDFYDGDEIEQTRLLGKAEGVRLAISYLNEYLREFP